jgi:hypothetical protein
MAAIPHIGCAAYQESQAISLFWLPQEPGVRGHVPEDVYAAARDHFSEDELVSLTMAVIATNGFNRLDIAFRPEVGDYRPGMFDQPKTA